jgi:Ca2+-binding RTX toxin-like protein
MAVTATFLPNSGTLMVLGDGLDNTIVTSRNAAGQILVNSGAVAIHGGTPTVANTSLIQVFGQGGNDNITLDEANGALPAALLFGGAGNDVLTGGSGADQLFGQSGNDTLLGRGGTDFLFGGADNDMPTGGDADDQVFGESGNDRMIWNPGDDTDLFEGGAGTDTAEVNGGNGDEEFTVTPNGTRVRFDRTNPAPFSIDIGTTENLVLNMNGGDDTFTAGNGLANLIKLTIDGGAGNDTITGGDGDDTLLGGDGNDVITGGRGSDTAQLGAGDDTFVWNPGDGSDVVEGEDGLDTLLFNGANIAEIFDVSANGERARFTRDVGNIVMDLNDVERIDVNVLGGADTTTVNDLTGTDVTQVNIDLAGTIGGTAGDGAADTVIANGSNGADAVDVVGAGTSVAVVGLPAQVNVTNSEGANDALVISTLGGDDVITATTLPAGITKLTIDARAGDDIILGSQGADVLRGGDGDDLVDGNRGDDVAFLGAGDDVFQWDPGDGSDTIEGQDGLDTLLFIGANIAENIDISANGGRALFFRNIANVTMDLNDVEQIDFRALGGEDIIRVNDLSGTDVTQVNINLAGTIGGTAGDGVVDRVIVSATAGDDVITVGTPLGAVEITGTAASVAIFGADATDQLIVNGGGGNDVINASGIQAGEISLSLNGATGADVLIGSQGDDTFVRNPFDVGDVVEGQDGFDTLLFNSVNEIINISANGERVLIRDVASVAMDLNDTEAIAFRALGGEDTITVNDLSGTDVSEVNINLAGAGGGADGQVDTIIINATNGDDVIQIVGDNSGITILGLAAQVNIVNFDANDQIIINGLAGDDVIEASGLAANIQFTANGGDGNDILVGSDGPDTLNGNAGDDVLLGGAGLDVLDGGPGDNVVIQGIAPLDNFNII